MFSILTLTFIFVRAVYAQWPAPDPCSGFCHSHDPSVIKHENGTYFRFSSGNTVATSLSLTGPWVHEPDALVGASAGAPNVIRIGQTYYLYYQYTVIGERQYSNISVATSPSMQTNSWIVHGNLSIPASPNYNLIDPNLPVVPANSTSSEPTSLLSFGSYWQDIFQIELENPLKVGNSAPVHLELNQTTGLPLGENPSEGLFQFRWTPGNQAFYYLFFSSGYCCTPDFQILIGEEYKIMVCRSDGPSGPFLDQQGRSCLSDNRGTLIYRSQYDTDRRIVYAPGGERVMYDENVDGGSVVLYYHYTANFTDTNHVATFWWNKLDFDEGGWPFVTALEESKASAASQAQ